MFPTFSCLLWHICIITLANQDIYLRKSPQISSPNLVYYPFKMCLHHRSLPWRHGCHWGWALLCVTPWAHLYSLIKPRWEFLLGVGVTNRLVRLGFGAFNIIEKHNLLLMLVIEHTLIMQPNFIERVNFPEKCCHYTKHFDIQLNSCYYINLVYLNPWEKITYTYSSNS